MTSPPERVARFQAEGAATTVAALIGRLRDFARRCEPAFGAAGRELMRP